MGTPRLRALLHWLPAALAVLVIAVESTTFMSANNTGRWLLPIWEDLFGPISMHHLSVVNECLRKAGHFIGYGLVSACFVYGFSATLRQGGENLRAFWLRCSAYAVACTILVASTDEFHQVFLPSRGGSVRDVALDTCGAIVAQILVLTLMPLLARPPDAPLAQSFPE